MRQGLGFRAQGSGWWVLTVLLLLGVAGRAQEISLAGDAAAKKGHVSLLSDDLVVEAGKVQVVELRFRVEEGFHINSHTPKDPLLIATALKLDAGDVKVLGVEYPQGAVFKLGSGADAETLDVYQGEFRVRVRVVAVRGSSTMVGTLHYQACDNAACFPPRDLAVKVAVTGK